MIIVLCFLTAICSFHQVSAVSTTEKSTFKCWTCASKPLRWYWQVTGFATRLNELLFTSSRCQNLDGMWEWWNHGKGPGGLRIDCQSACITWMTEWPDPADAEYLVYKNYLDPPLVKRVMKARQKCDNKLGGGAVDRGQISDFVVVRGCLDYLVGDPEINVPEAFCKWGQNRYQAQTTTFEFQVRRLTQFCKDELCNDVASFEDLRCVQQDDKNPCFKCAFDGYWTYTCRPIIADPCKGNWCYKRALWMGNTYTEQRGCSPVNPYGSSDTCSYIEEDSTLPTRKRRSTRFIGSNETSLIGENETLLERQKRGITIDYHGYVCYCKDPDGECNHAAVQFHFGLTFVGTSAFVLLYSNIT